MAYEGFHSFGRMPFKAGVDCFVKERPLYPDGWMSGAWEGVLPKGAKSLDLITISTRPVALKEPLSGDLEMLVWIPGRGKVPVSKQHDLWASDKPQHLSIDLPSEYYSTPHVVSARLQLSSCYTPRNIGVNTDSRRLGLLINEVQWK